MSGYQTGLESNKKKKFAPGKNARRRIRARKEKLLENLKTLGFSEATVLNRDVTGGFKNPGFLQKLVEDGIQESTSKRMPKRLKIIGDEQLVPPLNIKIVSKEDQVAAFWRTVVSKLPDSANSLNYSSQQKSIDKNSGS